MTDVSLAGVTKRFGDVVAVDALDLQLAPNQVTAVVGPSGCGKTTTLRLVAGFERPDAGTIRIGEHVVAGDGHFVPPERRRVGMVFQQLALFPHMTVAGNVGYGLSRSERSTRVPELLRLVNLNGYEARYPDELSGGQAQRVAVARALAPSPAVVLLDEPFSSLDVALRAGVRAEVRRVLEQAGVTALLVTHDQDEALSVGDRVAVMLNGRLAQVGSPEEVYRQPASPEVAAFLGDANLLHGDVRAGCFESPVGSLPAPGWSRPDGPAIGLVRPEDLDLDEAGGDAVVEDVHYFGHDQLIVVSLPSGFRLRARLHARRRFEPGARVGVRAVGGEVVAFPPR